MKKSHGKKSVAIVLGTTAAVLALAPLASGHATVSAVQPQGKALTSARVAYVLRVPNEKSTQNTFDVSMDVPEAAQRAISVRATADWVIKLTKVDTGEKNANGDAILKITRIRWISKPGMGAQIEPGFYGEFHFRITNPATPQKMCFPTIQWYTKKDANGKAEAVRWTGDASSATPASCVDVVAS